MTDKFSYGTYRCSKDNVDTEYWIAHLEHDSQRKFRVISWMGEDVILQPEPPGNPWLPININGSFVCIEGNKYDF